MKTDPELLKPERMSMRELSFRLQNSAKVVEGALNIDRYAELTHLAAQVGQHLGTGTLMIPRETKRKDPVGNFSDGGKGYQPTGAPAQVSLHAS